jgi:hypothetical protein
LAEIDTYGELGPNAFGFHWGRKIIGRKRCLLGVLPLPLAHVFQRFSQFPLDLARDVAVALIDKVSSSSSALRILIRWIDWNKSWR